MTQPPFCLAATWTAGYQNRGNIINVCAGFHTYLSDNVAVHTQAWYTKHLTFREAKMY